MQNKWRKNTQKGFTLLEMLVVLFVISLLLLLFIPNIGTHREEAENKGNEALQQVIQTQVDLYMLENKGKTPSFEDLKQGYLSVEQAKKAENLFDLTDGKVTEK